MTLVLENVKEEFLPSIKKFSQSIGAKCKIQNTESKNKKKQSSLQKALKELENGEFETFKTFEEYQKAMASV